MSTELYKRFLNFVEKFSEVGSNISKLNKSYNAAQGSYEKGNGRNTKAIQDTFYKLLSDEYQDKAPALGFVPLKGEILKKSIEAVGRIGR